MRELHEKEADPAEEHKPVLVETQGFQCMAFQDCRGKWRNFYNLELLPGEVEIVNSD